MKSSKLKYFRSRNYKLTDLIYLNLNNLDHANSKKILINKKYNNKLIIIKSKTTNIKISKKKMFNLFVKCSLIKKKLFKLTNISSDKKITVKQSKKIQYNFLKKILNKEGVLFNNPNINNPSDIKIDFMKKKIYSKTGKLFYLFLNKRIIGYLFIIIENKTVQFYDINVINPKKNGYLILNLFKFFFQNLKIKKETKLFSNIHAKNLRSIRFFKSLGFKIRKSYFLQIMTNINLK